ncbi:cyclase family protein [Paenibacillus filicis]|uniref:Cyclase family protein n=1 Tax=Paenibacillus filicis TaxID=669464 RepID=A0ABU9DSR5_9BACL
MGNEIPAKGPFVQFDFEVSFTHGGRLEGQRFRLKEDGWEAGESQLAELLVRELQLQSVREVRIFNTETLRENDAEVEDAERRSSGMPASIIDLSHTIAHGMETYPGFPAPQVSDYLSHEASKGRYAPGVTFNIGRIEMVANSGTSIDSPAHRYAGGADVAGLPLEVTADLDGVVVRLAGFTGRAVLRQHLEGYRVSNRAVLIETGRGRSWGLHGYFEEHPYLTKDAAAYLRDEGALLVAIDSHNIDDTSDPDRPVHTILLDAGIPIVENLTGTEQLPDEGFRFTAAPMKIQGMSAFPIRAWARITDGAASASRQHS